MPMGILGLILHSLTFSGALYLIPQQMVVAMRECAQLGPGSSLVVVSWKPHDLLPACLSSTTTVDPLTTSFISCRQTSCAAGYTAVYGWLPANLRKAMVFFPSLQFCRFGIQ